MRLRLHNLCLRFGQSPDEVRSRLERSDDADIDADLTALYKVLSELRTAGPASGLPFDVGVFPHEATFRLTDTLFLHVKDFYEKTPQSQDWAEHSETIKTKYDAFVAAQIAQAPAPSSAGAPSPSPSDIIDDHRSGKVVIPSGAQHMDGSRLGADAKTSNLYGLGEPLLSAARVSVLKLAIAQLAPFDHNDSLRRQAYADVIVNDVRLSLDLALTQRDFLYLNAGPSSPGIEAAKTFTRELLRSLGRPTVRAFDAMTSLSKRICERLVERIVYVLDTVAQGWFPEDPLILALAKDQPGAANLPAVFLMTCHPLDWLGYMGCSPPSPDRRGPYGRGYTFTDPDHLMAYGNSALQFLREELQSEVDSILTQDPTDLCGQTVKAQLEQLPATLELDPDHASFFGRRKKISYRNALPDQPQAGPDAKRLKVDQAAPPAADPAVQPALAAQPAAAPAQPPAPAAPAQQPALAAPQQPALAAPQQPAPAPNAPVDLLRTSKLPLVWKTAGARLKAIWERFVRTISGEVMKFPDLHQRLESLFVPADTDDDSMGDLLRPIDTIFSQITYATTLGRGTDAPCAQTVLDQDATSIPLRLDQFKALESALFSRESFEDYFPSDGSKATTFTNDEREEIASFAVLMAAALTNLGVAVCRGNMGVHHWFDDSAHVVPDPQAPGGFLLAPGLLAYARLTVSEAQAVLNHSPHPYYALRNPATLDDFRTQTWFTTPRRSAR